MRTNTTRWIPMLTAAIMLALSAGPILAKSSPKDKKKEDPAKALQAPVPAPAPAAKPVAQPQTRPAGCPATCPNCPWNPKNAAAAAPVPAPVAAPAATPTTCPAPGPRGPGGGGWRGGRGGGGGPPWMRTNPDDAVKAGAAPGSAQADPRSPMEVFHSLLNQHAKIRRTVEEIPGGIFTVTTSDDPAIARDIQVHVWQMKSRLENGQPLRRWDPLFEELFRHGSKITMKIEQTRDGAKVTETSDDPQVVKLIRQHAIRGVSEFVKDGFDRAHKASPLPEGYVAPAAQPQQAKPVQSKESAPAGPNNTRPVDWRPRWGQQGR